MLQANYTMIAQIDFGYDLKNNNPRNKRTWLERRTVTVKRLSCCSATVVQPIEKGGEHDSVHKYCNSPVLREKRLEA